MTITELQIQLDLNPDNRVSVLKNVDLCRWTIYNNYLFVDQEDGQCYSFDKDGNLNDISNVKIIGACAFYNCTSLTRIKIPDSVKNIEYGVFADCAFLTNIEIPNNVKHIGRGTFYRCISLKKVVFKNKTIDQIKAMENYPWGIQDISIIKTES